MTEDEIKVREGSFKSFIEQMRKTSLLKDPKLVRISVTFRDSNNQIETKAFNHKSFNKEDYEE